MGYAMIHPLGDILVALSDDVLVVDDPEPARGLVLHLGHHDLLPPKGVPEVDVVVVPDLDWVQVLLAVQVHSPDDVGSEVDAHVLLDVGVRGLREGEDVVVLAQAEALLVLLVVLQAQVLLLQLSQSLLRAPEYPGLHYLLEVLLVSLRHGFEHIREDQVVLMKVPVPDSHQDLGVAQRSLRKVVSHSPKGIRQQLHYLYNYILQSMDQPLLDLPISSKTQRSANDLVSVNETQFLEKYLLQIIKDELSIFLVDSLPAFQHYQAIITQQQFVQFQLRNLNQPQSSLFIAITHFTLPDLIDSIQSLLNVDTVSYDEILLSSHQLARQDVHNPSYYSSPKSPLETEERKSIYSLLQTSSFSDIPEPSLNAILPLYSNFDNHVQFGDILFIEVILRLPSQKLKQMIGVITRKLKRIFADQQNKEYLKQVGKIKVLLLYNGDINTDFEKIFEKFSSLKLEEMEVEIKVTISYISKQAIFYYFRNNTGQKNLEYVDEKVSTFFNISQISKKRSKILEQMQQQKSEVVSQEKQKSGRGDMKVIGLVGVACFVGIYMVLKRKQQS